MPIACLVVHFHPCLLRGLPTRIDWRTAPDPKWCSLSVSLASFKAVRACREWEVEGKKWGLRARFSAVSPASPCETRYVTIGCDIEVIPACNSSNSNRRASSLYILISPTSFFLVFPRIFSTFIIKLRACFVLNLPSPPASLPPPPRRWIDRWQLKIRASANARTILQTEVALWVTCAQWSFISKFESQIWSHGKCARYLHETHTQDRRLDAQR